MHNFITQSHNQMYIVYTNLRFSTINDNASSFIKDVKNRLFWCYFNMILPEFFDRCRSSWLLTNWSIQLQLLKDKRKIWLWPIQEPSLLFSLSTKCLPLLLIQTRQRIAASACHKHLLLERNDKIYTNFSDLNVKVFSILIKRSDTLEN